MKQQILWVVEIEKGDQFWREGSLTNLREALAYADACRQHGWASRLVKYIRSE